MKRLRDVLVLPREMSDFERRYLARVNRIALYFFYGHLPVFVLFAFLNHTQPLLAGLLTAGVLVGPTLAYRSFSNPRLVSMVYGVTAMFMGGILVHVGQGPVQIEMHFYFFALIAMLAVFGNPLVILSAAGTVALHHLILWFLWPSSVFNYDAPVWVVAVHAAFVILESVAGVYIARSFFDNVIGLEKIVRARTAELDGRNRDMRVVLDHVQEGLITLDIEGRMSNERSAIVARWLGAAPEDRDFAAYLEAKDPVAGGAFRVGWTQVTDDILPVDVALDQLPRTCTIGAQRLSLEWTPIFAGDKLDKVLLVLSDVTAQLERERLEREQREMVALFQGLVRDRQGLVEFCGETGDQIAAFRDGQGDLGFQRRLVHTVKGNASIFGLSSIADLCHEIERTIDEEGQPPTAETRERLHAAWRPFAEYLKRFLGEGDRDVVEIDAAELVATIEAARAGASGRAIAKRLADWRLEPLERRFGRLAEQARGLARRLNKGDIDVRIEDGGARIEPREWSSFWSVFVHAIRNAVDHGLETADERHSGGKPAPGALELCGRVEGSDLLIEIGDDGRGIDWSAVAAKAAELGLAHATREDLIEALFVDGLSTATTVTQVSGRGVGMGAVRAACSALGGTVSIASEPGRGTRIVFRFRRDTAAQVAA